MTLNRRYLEVAVAGPLRRTFTYHFDQGTEVLYPGRRLLVPFGRSRKVGYYLSEVKKPTRFETRPIIRLLDESSLFPTDLFDFAIWMADYYFANPADCLSAALPGRLKKQKSISYRWADKCENIPDELRGNFRASKKLNSDDLAWFKNRAGQTITRAIEEGLVVESFADADDSPGSMQIKFAASEPERWAEFFASRKFQPQSFEGQKSKKELKDDGWSDHFVSLAAKEKLLLPVATQKSDDILSFIEAKEDVTDLQLTAEQSKVYGAISPKLGAGFGVHLLHGVTGSGKTLVYCHLVRAALERGKTALVLTPEISLSGATLAWFRGFFPGEVTISHSAMTERERLESWRGIRSGKYRVVVGPRSAIFAPLKNIGLIVVDEEHDSSYKQDDPAPRFHGRDCAIMRARLNDVPVLLGSASPSFESYHNARIGRYQLHNLTMRPADARLPEVNIVDMNTDRIKGAYQFLSHSMKQKIEDCISQGNQSILFLNRRGYSPRVFCCECNHVPSCDDCRIVLTYHKSGEKLSCHYCGQMKFGYKQCEQCGSEELIYIGAGTQKIEEMLPRIFPDAKILRFDSDTASGRKASHRILADFASGKANLLLGTQMVTKGLDMPGVTLVGVLDADQGMSMPDFRADEKTFARLLQVAGRSGRGTKPGEVVIQTHDAEHEVIVHTKSQDYEDFFDLSIKVRQETGFPPFCRLVNFIVSGPNEKKVTSAIGKFSAELKSRCSGTNLVDEIFEPTDCPINFVRKNFRKRIVVKTSRIVGFTKMLSEWESSETKFGFSSTVKMNVDVDPDDMM